MVGETSNTFFAHPYDEKQMAYKNETPAMGEAIPL